MDNLISYREVLDCLMLMRQETPTLHVSEHCKLISRMFGKNIGEVRFDLKELTKECS